jgi:hypothetical protein
MLAPNEVPQFQDGLQPQVLLAANGKNSEVEAMERVAKGQEVKKWMSLSQRQGQPSE